MKAKTIEELRDKFFMDCTNMNNGRPRVDMSPHNLFEWIKRNIIQPEPIVSEPKQENELQFQNLTCLVNVYAPTYQKALAKQEYQKLLSLPKSEQVTEGMIEEMVLKEYPKREFWIGDGETGRLHDENLKERIHYTKGIRKGLTLQNKKQVTDDEILSQLDLLILNWLKSGNENTTHLSFLIVEYFKGLSLKEPQKLDKKIRKLMSKPSEITYEEVFNQENRDKVKEYILDQLNNPNQVTEDEMYNELDVLILNWLKSGNENTTQLSFLIVRYFKGLSLQNKDIVSGAVCDHVFYPSVEMDGTRFEYCRSCGERK